MRIISLHMLKWDEDNSLFISSVYDLSFVSWYQRPFFKDTVNFGARTACNRTKPNEPLALSLPDAQAKCYIYVNKYKIAAAILTDDQYPERVAFQIINRMHKEFASAFDSEKLATSTVDQNLPFPKLDEYIKNYQDPKEVDKLEKLKESLKEVEGIVHKNLDDIMKRGETLEKLMEKSKDVSALSYDFYKTAKKANTRCCSLY